MLANNEVWTAPMDETYELLGIEADSVNTLEAYMQVCVWGASLQLGRKNQVCLWQLQRAIAAIFGVRDGISVTHAVRKRPSPAYRSTSTRS